MNESLAMTLTQLKHFIDLAQTCSFGSSARRLHITQPALSRSIKALEEEFGHLLFDRVGRGIELTSFGREVWVHAQSLVDLAQELRQRTQQAQQGLSGRVHIGLSSGPGTLLGTVLMQHMVTHAPQAHLQISRGSAALLVQALRDRQLDALVIDVRGLKPSVDLRVEVLPELQAAFMCRKGHPLSNKRSVKLSDLQAYPVASTPLSDEVARMLIERYGTAAHPDELITLRCDEISQLLDVVRQSDAIILAACAVASDLVHLPLTPSLNATARYGIVTLASRSTSPLLGALRQQIVRTLGGSERQLQ